MINKNIDCVKMKHKIQEKLYKRLKPVSIDDYFSKLEDYSKSADLFSKWAFILREKQ